MSILFALVNERKKRRSDVNNIVFISSKHVRTFHQKEAIDDTRLVSSTWRASWRHPQESRQLFRRPSCSLCLHLVAIIVPLSQSSINTPDLLSPLTVTFSLLILIQVNLTPMIPPELVNWGSNNYLVPSGDDELFLVQQIIPRGTGVLKL